MTTTAYKQKVDALRKQLDQDVSVACWSDRIQEAPDGTLEVSFGSSGISKPRTISIASLNIQGCKHTESEEEQGKGKGVDKLELLVRDIIGHRRDVLLLQHTGEKAPGQLELPAAEGTGIKYFVHGVQQENNRIHGGVGIFLSKRAAKAWEEAGSPEPIGSGLLSGTARFMSLNLDWKDSRGRILRYRIISLYMPTSSYPEDEYEAVLEELERKVLDGCKQDRRTPIIGADINGSVGICNNTEEEEEGSDRLSATNPIGPYGIDKPVNRNGEIFTTFMAKHKLCSALMWARGNFCTWRSPRRTAHFLDHIVIPRKHLHRAKRQGRYAPAANTDHLGVSLHLLSEAKLLPKDLSKIRWEREKKRKEMKERPPEADFKRIQGDPVLRSKVIVELEAILNDSTTDFDHTDLQGMMDLWNATGASIAPREKRKPSPSWFQLSAEVLLPAIGEKKRITEKYYRDGDTTVKTKLAKMRRACADLVEAAKIRWVEKKVEELENKYDPRKAWKAMREISTMFAGHIKSAVTMRMRKKDGTLATTEAENGAIFCEHFNGVFNAPATAQEGIEEVIEQRATVAELGELPSDDEINFAITRAANEKSPGADGIPIEAFKIIRESDILFGEFVHSLHAYWTDPNVDPESFHTSLMSVLPKKGDLSDPNKWRGISLLSVASKLVSSIVATRLGKHFLEVGLDEQCGGVFGKGCIDGTYNVKQALHTLSQHGADSYVIFADLVKAYDTVDRELLWKIMSRYGCPEELIFVLRKLYTDITIELKSFGKGFTIPSTVGVKQGDNLAPVLFIFFINAVAESIEPEWKEADIEVPWLSSYFNQEAKQEKRHGHSALIGKRTNVFDFFLSYYVDDAAFILMNRQDAEKAATLIVRHFRKFGLTIHVGNREEGTKSKTEALYVPSMWRGISKYEDIPSEEIADIEIVGDDFAPGTYMSFTPVFKYLGTVISWDLRENKDVQARIKAANKIFGSAKATFWSNSRVPFELRMRFYKAIVVNVLLWGCESWAIQSKEVQALRVFQFRCLRSILKINIMHKISRVRILKMCQVQDIIQTMDLRRIKWIEKLSFMDFTRCPRLLFGCWMYGKVYHRDSKPLKTIGHSHTDSLRRIGEASFLEDGVTVKAPFIKKRQAITVSPGIYDLFRLIHSESWPPMMEKYLGLDPGSYTTFEPTIPGKIPPRRTRVHVITNEPTTPNNNQGPMVCRNCQCIDCPGPPCLSPLSRPPYCNSCGFRHGPTYIQCSSASTPMTTPNNAFTADDIEAAITELSPSSPQTEHTTMSQMINALTNATIASVIATIETPATRRTTRNRPAQSNLTADFDFEFEYDSPTLL